MKIQLEFAVAEAEAQSVRNLFAALRLFCPGVGSPVVGAPVVTVDRRVMRSGVVVMIDTVQLVTKNGQVGAVCS